MTEHTGTLKLFPTSLGMSSKDDRLSYCACQYIVSIIISRSIFSTLRPVFIRNE